MRKLHRGTDTTFYEIAREGVRTFATDRGTPEGHRTHENLMSFEQFDQLAAAVQSFRDVMDAKPKDAVEPSPPPASGSGPAAASKSDGVDSAREALEALSDRTLQRTAVKLGVKVAAGIKGEARRAAMIDGVLAARKKAPAKRPAKKNT